MLNRTPILAYKISYQPKSDGTQSEPDLRLITIVGNQPFYLSSGVKSGFRGTFFPFGGLLTDSISIGTFMKPIINHESEAYFPKDICSLILSTFGEENGKNFMHRIGNLKMIVISMMLGAGIWNEPQSEKLKNHLRKYYQPYIDKIAKENEDQIKFIRQQLRDDKAQIQELSVTVSDDPALTKEQKKPFEEIIKTASDKINKILVASESNKASPLQFQLQPNGNPCKISYSLFSADEDGHLDEFYNKHRKRLILLFLTYFKAYPSELVKREFLFRLGFNPVKFQVKRHSNVSRFMEVLLDTDNVETLLTDDCFLPYFTKENYETQLLALKRIFFSHYDSLIKQSGRDQIKILEQIKTTLTFLNQARITGFSSPPKSFFAGGVKVQSKEIWDEHIQPKLDEKRKVAILYSANSRQAKSLLDSYAHPQNYRNLKSIFRRGKGQAQLFHALVDNIKNDDEAKCFHILPVATSRRGGENEIGNHVSLQSMNEHLANIAWHIGNGWDVMGLNKNNAFKIGGRASKYWYRRDPIFIYQSASGGYGLYGVKETKAFSRGLIALAIFTGLLILLALVYIPPLGAMIASAVIYGGSLLGITIAAKTAAVVFGSLLMGGFAAVGYSILGGIASLFHRFVPDLIADTKTLPRKISQGQYIEEHLDLMANGDFHQWPEYLKDAYMQGKAAAEAPVSTQAVVMQDLAVFAKSTLTLNVPRPEPVKEEEEAIDMAAPHVRPTRHEEAASLIDSSSSVTNTVASMPSVIV